MRALRVVGLGEDGNTVICEDPARGERFTIPADERLRAAARGDVTRLGQIEIELESQMRPREIQARIRAGESVEQVANTAGLPAHKVERFAYPVLLERSRTAELAQRAHPVREDGPDVQTLAEVAAHAFGLRGQDYSTATWDSWRGEDGKWVVQLQWTTGRSENRAHWAFHPGAHGGTVVPLDDHAFDLMDPNAASRPLRTVRPVTELARQAIETPPPAPAPAEPEPEVIDVTEPEPEPAPPAAEPVEPPPAPVAPVTKPPVAKPAVAKPVERKPAERKPPERKPVAKPVERKPAPKPEPEPEELPVELVEQPEPQEPVTPEPPAAEPEPATPAASTSRKQEQAPAPKRGKKNHPIVPSWEDVLLGVRGQRG